MAKYIWCSFCFTMFIFPSTQNSGNIFLWSKKTIIYNNWLYLRIFFFKSLRSIVNFPRSLIERWREFRTVCFSTNVIHIFPFHSGTLHFDSYAESIQHPKHVFRPNFTVMSTEKYYIANDLRWFRRYNDFPAIGFNLFQQWPTFKFSLDTIKHNIMIPIIILAIINSFQTNVFHPIGNRSEGLLPTSLLHCSQWWMYWWYYNDSVFDQPISRLMDVENHDSYSRIHSN